jgi:hypothetical protein
MVSAPPLNRKVRRAISRAALFEEGRMKRTRLLWLGCASAFLMLGGGATAVAQTGAGDVEQVISNFLVAFSNRDVGRFIDYFSQDALSSSRRAGLDFQAVAFRAKRRSRVNSKQATSASVQGEAHGQQFDRSTWLLSTSAIPPS